MQVNLRKFVFYGILFAGGDMSEIPVINCPECGSPMEYRGGPSDSNLFIMTCPTPGCGYQQTYYLEADTWLLLHV